MCRIYVTNRWRLIWVELVSHMGVKRTQHMDFYSRTVNSEGTEHMTRGQGSLRSRVLYSRTVNSEGTEHMTRGLGSLRSRVLYSRTLNSEGTEHLDPWPGVSEVSSSL